MKLNKHLLIGIIFVASVIPVCVALADIYDSSTGDFGLQSASETASGNFTHDNDNDALFWILVYDSTDLVSPDSAVGFYGVISDIDNSTTQFTIILFYSANSFASTSNYSMTYDSLYDIDQYRYNLTFPGQSGGTYYEYYYQAYDGNSTVTENNGGLYYDVQWDDAPSGPGGGIRPPPDDEETTTTTTTERVAPISGDYITISFTGLVFGLIILLGIKQYLDTHED